MSETNNTKQAAWVALGSMFSFAFGIVSSMILSRYFDKVEYGTYKQVLYVYNSLLAIFTLGLPKAYSYFLPRSPLNEAKSLIKKITNLFFILGGILSLFLFFASGLIADFLKNPDLETSLKIFAPVPFLMMPTMGLEGILATYKKTKFLSIYTFVTRFIMLLAVALPVVLFNLNCNESLIGFVLGSFLSFIIAIYLKYYPVKKEESKNTKYSYNEIFTFTFPLFVATIWGILINSTDQFLVSRYFGTEVFAEFSNGSMELPFVGMIIGACSTVLTPLFTKKVYEERDFKKSIYPIWNNALVKSAMLIYPIVLFCLYDADLIMRIMYGDMYTGSGAFFRIKLFTYFTKIISFYSILIALGETKFYAKVFMYGFFVLFIVEYISILLFNDPLIVTFVHVLYTNVVCFIFLRHIAKCFGINSFILLPLKIIAKILFASLFSLIPVYFLKGYLYGDLCNLYIVIIDLLIFGCVYSFIGYILNLRYVDMLNILKKK